VRILRVKFDKKSADNNDNQENVEPAV